MIAFSADTYVIYLPPHPLRIRLKGERRTRRNDARTCPTSIPAAFVVCDAHRGSATTTLATATARASSAWSVVCQPTGGSMRGHVYTKSTALRCVELCPCVLSWFHRRHIQLWSTETSDVRFGPFLWRPFVRWDELAPTNNNHNWAWPQPLDAAIARAAGVAEAGVHRAKHTRRDGMSFEVPGPCDRGCAFHRLLMPRL